MADLVPSIREMLRDGFGCEDIAVQLGVPVEGVRRLMRGWQKTGVIKAVLSRACAPDPQTPRKEAPGERVTTLHRADRNAHAKE